MKSILFNTEMVKAILNGRKTVVRRAIKDVEISGKNDCTIMARIIKPKRTIYYGGVIEDFINEFSSYQVGDILYVRETWCDRWLPDGFLQGEQRYGYKADGEHYYGYWGNDKQCKNNVWIPPIYMPKEAARIFLKVTDVRVERLQDISIMDIEKEGFSRGHAIDETWYERGKKDFIDLWDSAIDMKNHWMDYGFGANPWVWVIEFEKISKEEAYGYVNCKNI